MVEHGCTEGKRFDRIEELLTKLSDLLVSNATCDIRIDHTEAVAVDHEARIRALEKEREKDGNNGKWVERIMWLLFATAVGVLASGVQYG